MAGNEKKLGVIPLAALVVSAMIGGGIFSLPQNMAQGAGVIAVIIAWIVTGIGMYFIANTFRVLADARPDATTGIYAYARLGISVVKYAQWNPTIIMTMNRRIGTSLKTVPTTFINAACFIPRRTA